jgi:Transposase DDE domain group 1
VVESIAGVLLFDRLCSTEDAAAHRLAGTELEKAQCGTIRLKLLKIGAQVRVTVRKVWVSLSGAYPYAALFARVLVNLEAGCVSP